MSKIISFAKLPFIIDADVFKKEVLLLSDMWKPHFNTKHYEGDWSVIALRSVGGVIDNIIPDNFKEQGYKNTALLDLCPNIAKFINLLECEVMSVRLLILKPGAFIKEHRDPELSFEQGEARLHLPVFTNNQVEFFVENNLLFMPEGSSWYINANLPHRASNKGSVNRIHLVIDCIVNDWLKSIFAQSEITFANEDSEGILKLIKELKLQNTVTSLHLADQLQTTIDNV